MCNSIEMKYSEGPKLLEFKLSGFNEENSLSIAKDIMEMVTESGKRKAIRKTITLSDRAFKNYKKKIPEQNNEQIHSDLVAKTEISNVIAFNNENEVPQDITPTDDTIPVFNSDNETFQTYYICKCGDRGKHQIKRSQIYVNCRSCGKRMRIRDAHMDGFPMKDDYGNTFIAEEFKRSDELKYGAAFY